MIAIRPVLSADPMPGQATGTAVVTVAAVAVIAASLLATGSAVAAVAAEDAELEVAAGDVDIGDEYQSLDLRLEGVESGETVDVYVNVTGLETAGVALDDAWIEVVDAFGADVTDTEVVDEDGTVVARLSLEAGTDERAAVDARLTGIDTGDADEATGLHHYAAVSDTERVGENAPDGDDHRSTSYDVVDPSEVNPHTHVSPGSVAIGSDNQTVTVRVADATEDFTLEIDVTSLTDAGVGIDGAGVEVGETHGFDVAGTTVTDGVVEIRVVAEDEVGDVRVRITDLDTDGATPVEDLTYPVSVDGEPADPDESMSFDVFDPDERDDGNRDVEGTLTPTPIPAATPTPGGHTPEDGGGNGDVSGDDGGNGDASGSDDGAMNTDDGTDTGVTDDNAPDDRTDDDPSAVSGPGFGLAAVGVAALLAALFARAVRR